MKKLSVIVFTVLSLMMAMSAFGQDTKRARPAEWNGLVEGGRFMDRFLPIPVRGELSSDTWGVDAVKPRDIHNGIEDRMWSYWGGNILKSTDGKYHMYVCRWPENAKKGHMEWPRSEVVHAVSDSQLGPYRVQEKIGKGHNPEAFRLKNGTYVIYVMNGYYHSDKMNGPWQYKKFKFETRDRRIIEGLSNLSFAQREDGSYLMVCRGGGMWVSRTGLSPYNQVSNERVYPKVAGNFEDPVLWRTNIQYHMIVNDWRGRIAYYLRSKNGFHWKVEPGEAYMPGIAKYENGTVVDWYKFERIKMLQDEHGRAIQANFAVIDYSKWKDKGSDNHSSKNIGIPLTPGRLLTILDDKKITADTKSIRVKIAAEKGFDPQTDMDIQSLRFGASDEVNFGRGSRVVKTEPSGKDIIVTFDGRGNGINDDHFSAKLLGKTRNNKLLFGYARLPWLNYDEPFLSAREPKISKEKDGYAIEIEVQNFGQVTSKSVQASLEFRKGEKLITVTGGIPTLAAYEKKVIKITGTQLFERGKTYDLRIITANQKTLLFQKSVIPIPVPLKSKRGSR